MPSHRNTEPDPLRGSIDLLILKALSLESMHGWGIGARIQQMSRGRLDVNQGSLYPALQRLEKTSPGDSPKPKSDKPRRKKKPKLGEDEIMTPSL